MTKGEVWYAVYVLGTNRQWGPNFSSEKEADAYAERKCEDGTSEVLEVRRLERRNWHAR